MVEFVDSDLLRVPETDRSRWRSPRAGTRDDRDTWGRLLSGRALTLVTLVLDLVTMSLSVAATLAWSSTAGMDTAGGITLWLFPLLGVAWMSVRGLYRRRMRVAFVDDLPLVVSAVSLSAMTMLTILVLTELVLAPGRVAVMMWVTAIPLVAAGRLARASVLRYAKRKCKVGTPTLIIGTGAVGVQIARRLKQLPEYGLRPIGFIDDGPAPDHPPDLNLPILGNLDDFVDVAEGQGAEHVIVAFSGESDYRLLAVTRCCQAMGLKVSIVPRLFDAVGEQLQVQHLGGLPLLTLGSTDPRSWRFAVKHVIDRIGAALGILALSPVLIAITLAVRLTSPGPIFFRQRRIGRDGQPFDLLKFRSMRIPEDKGGRAFKPQTGTAPGGVEGVDRRTPIGRFLRRSSLDELPQLCNVLKGDMTLVGPRPERPEYVVLFQEQIRRYGERHRVKAGMTGWAQVHGLRGQTSIADRAEWDNYYIENWSLTLDLKILALTVLALLHRSEE